MVIRIQESASAQKYPRPVALSNERDEGHSRKLFSPLLPSKAFAIVEPRAAMEAMSKQRIRADGVRSDPKCWLECLSEELLFLVLDRLSSADAKSLSLLSRSFHRVEARHRRSLSPLRSDLLPVLLSRRYSSISHLDLSRCSSRGGLSDASFASLAPLLRSINLSSQSSYSLQAIHSLADHCLLLEDLDLSHSIHLPHDQAAAAVARMPRLQRLTMAGCKTLTDLGLASIAVGCPDLRLLCLKGCVALTDLGLAFIALKCTKLTSLDVSFTMMTKKCMPTIMQLPHLQQLRAIGCLAIDDTTLLNGCNSLQGLHLSNCQSLTSTAISSLLNSYPNLQQLSLTYCPSIHISSLMTLKSKCTLHSIKLDGCKVTAAGLKSLSDSCISLKELSLSKCPGANDDGIVVIVAKHKDLKKIDITCCKDITDRSLVAITSSCTSLVSLRMESATKVTCEGLRLIGQHCRELEELDLTDNDLDDEGLRCLARCCNLVSLKIGICLKITDEGLIHIGRSCSRLQELDLYRSVGITDRGVSEIACGCPNLEMINMGYCTNISDESLQCLSKCSRLTTLEVRACLRISSVGVSAVATGCRQLSKLDIKKCGKVNDVAMFSLAQYSHNLRRMHLSYCSVTDAGLLALLRLSCLRSMTMFHLSAVSPKGLMTALLMSNSLTKIKVQASLKPFLPQVLIEHVESRGCSVRWSNKLFQVELESREQSQLWVAK